ncbi:MAG TPA: hypothetical protein VK283_01660, partial [Acidimicrobiales bacterium]|nr:hypothetical protein [Acidimicrobiales bacterium]
MQLRDRARRRAALGFAGVLLTALTLTVGGPGLGPDAGATPPALNVVPTNLPFGEATLGTYVGPLKLTIGNGSASEDTTTFVFSGPAPNDFAWTFGGNCPTPLDAAGKVIPMPAYSSCTVDFYFFPGALGARNATLSLIDTANSGAAITLSGTGGIGYYQVSTTGSVGYAGDAGFYGDASTLKLNHPIVGMAQTGDNGGYWLAASDGGVFNYGDAPFFGSAGALPLNKPIVGMAATYDATGPTGYWLVASDGGIFT